MYLLMVLADGSAFDEIFGVIREYMAAAWNFLLALNMQINGNTVNLGFLIIAFVVMCMFISIFIKRY